jgi:starvation-inducible DNA-binding protein
MLTSLSGALEHQENWRNSNVSKISIGLSDEQRAGVAGLLRKVLADEYVLYTKTRKYHWNVQGPNFHDLHKIFEAQYEELDEAIDEVAEKIRSLGHFAPGSLSEFLKDARLKEDSGGPVDVKTMVGNLLADHESLIQSLRVDLETAKESFNDAGTQDFLTGLLQDHEKTAWMLRAMLG